MQTLKVEEKQDYDGERVLKVEPGIMLITSVLKLKRDVINNI